MRANRAYQLIVSRAGLEPAFMADAKRRDRVEVVSVDDGEVVLYWAVEPKLASRLLRELRQDLVDLDSEAFLDKWIGADAEDLF
jgi:hypothetical protein